MIGIALVYIHGPGSLVLGCLWGYAYINFHELPLGEQGKDMRNQSIEKRLSELQAQQRNNIYQPNHKISVDIVVKFHSISVAVY